MAMCSEAGGAAAKTWQEACQMLGITDSDASWISITDSSPPEDIWHCLRHCVAYQAEVWQNFVSKGMKDVNHPAAFQMAIVLRHTPTDVTVKILSDVLKGHEQAQPLTSYILALLTDDDPSQPTAASSAPPAPLRDLQLFGDCELAVLAGPRHEYDDHARRVRAEYAKLGDEEYSELRIKVLNQITRIPKLFHTPEFETLEAAARQNIEREISALRNK